MPNLKQQIVDWTLQDHYASHWGAAMQVSSVTSALRSFEYGSRETWCDLLTELVEGDPHAHATLKKCYASIVNREWELVPPQTETEAEAETAAIVAASVKATIEAIPMWSASLYSLLWGHFSGASASEIMWGYGQEWYVKGLRSIPSRRIDFDDFFRPYVPTHSGSNTGVRFEDYPGKFLCFLPTVTGEQPTREGLGRILVYWMAFKRWAMRDLMSYAERYGKPTPIVTVKTGKPKADENDVRLADSLIAGIGRGTQPGARIPDTLTVDFADAAGGSSSGTKGTDRTVHAGLIDLCNSEISKAVLGGTLTTEVGSTGGNRSLGERQGEDQEAIQSAIARQLDEVVTRDLVRWIVLLNFGQDVADKFTPRYHTKVEQSEDLTAAVDVLEKLVGIGLEVPVVDVYARFGWRAPADGEDVLKKADPPPMVPTPGGSDGPQEDPVDEDDDSPEDGEDEEE